MLEKRREAYRQKKRNEQEQRVKRCAQDRQRYANMNPEKKKARIEQVRAYRKWKRNTPCKESIAMVNPAYIATEQEVLLEKHHQAYQQKKRKKQDPTFIATEQEVGTSNLNVRQRKPLPPKQIQTLIHHGNKELLAKQRKIVSKMLVFDINWKI
jgi:hypothetical protein